MSTANYEYPLQTGWSTQDIIDVTAFYAAVEQAYESPQGISADNLLLAYNRFKAVVPHKFEEKQLGTAFETASGYSLYRTVKTAQRTQGNVRMKGDH